MYTRFKENHSNVKIEDIKNIQSQLKPEKNKMDKIIINALDKCQESSDIKDLFDFIEEELEQLVQNSEQDPQAVLVKFEDAVIARLTSLARLNLETDIIEINKEKSGFESHPQSPVEGSKEKTNKFKGLFK